MSSRLGSVLLLLTSFPVGTDGPIDPLAGIDEYVKVTLANWKTPGIALAVLKDGKVVLAHGYGVRLFGDEDEGNEQTIIPIASVTKVFTASCLAQLVEEGRL